MLGPSLSNRPTLPETIGKYEILGHLGEGAMGVVHRARDPFLDRAVALKTVSPAVLTRRDSIKRFKREARAAARLQHPNIVTIYELGEVDGRPFIAMELLEGMDMAAALKQRDRYSSSQLLKMTADICRALDYAHKNGVVHRDVKPANVRVQLDGNVKLVDFGIARLADSHLTQTGTVLGTPLYTAPEVLRSGRVDHRSDMWSAGVILYEGPGRAPPISRGQRGRRRATGRQQADAPIWTRAFRSDSWRSSIGRFGRPLPSASRTWRRWRCPSSWQRDYRLPSSPKCPTMSAHTSPRPTCAGPRSSSCRPTWKRLWRRHGAPRRSSPLAPTSWH